MYICLLSSLNDIFPIVVTNYENQLVFLMFLPLHSFKMTTGLKKKSTVLQKSNMTKVTLT